MHTFIYSSQDTYINNSNKFIDRNFGLDEILEIYATNHGYKTVYLSSFWHDVPVTSSSYGNEGWLAYDNSNIYIYSGSAWRKFGLTSSVIPNTSFIANFTGRLQNQTTSPLYVSGSSTFVSGSISGSINLSSYAYSSGSYTTGSFSGSLLSGTSFTTLQMGPSTYTTSPLTASLTGTGSFKNLTGTILGKSNTGIACVSGQYLPVKHFNSGSFSGSFTSSNFNGYVETTSSNTVFFTDVVNFTGYFRGQYNGTFTRPSTSDYLVTPELSRTLLKFELSALSQSISDGTISGSDIKITLNLKACGARNLPMNYKLYAYPLSSSWNNGNGRYADDGSEYGASWNYTDYKQSGGGLWYGNSTTSSYVKVDYLLTASNGTGSFQNQGGTWYYNVPSSYTNKPQWFCSSSAYAGLENADLICSQSFSYGQQSDVSMDITKIVRAWLCGCVPNHGLIVMSSFEIDTPPLQRTNGLLQFFSRETNTIYSPYLDVGWDDSVYNTGSLSPVTGSTENIITLQQLGREYKAGSLPKVFVYARDRYPLKSFSKSFQQPSMVTPKYLPSSSYYMIKDAESEEVIVGFDQYTKLSCDPVRGNYFKLPTTGLPQERYFKIFIKTEYDDGTIDITDTQKLFKIIR